MPKLEIKQKAQLTRKQASDRLIALGRALATGSEVELDSGGDSISLVVADRLEWELEIEVDGDQVEIEVEFSWRDAHPTVHKPMRTRTKTRSRTRKRTPPKVRTRTRMKTRARSRTSHSRPSRDGEPRSRRRRGVVGHVSAPPTDRCTAPCAAPTFASASGPTPHSFPPSDSVGSFGPPTPSLRSVTRSDRALGTLTYHYGLAYAPHRTHGTDSTVRGPD